MNVTVVSAGAQTGKSAIRALLKHDVKVTGIFRDPAKAPSELTAHPNFKAVQGDVSATLDLTGADVVIVTIPPIGEPRDIVTAAKERASNIKTAVEKAAGTVKRVVLLTSIGAQFSTGVVRLYRYLNLLTARARLKRTT